MRSQNTLVWVGAVAAAIVVAGASALYWTHPDFLWWNPTATRVVANAPESKPQVVPPAPPPVQPPPPATSAPEPGQAAATASSSLEPAFDVVNVDPSGEAVIAGRAAPNEKVELRDAGKTVAEATADAAGQFVIIPPAFAPGDHSLSLAASADKGQLVISKSVAVSVAAQEVKAAAATLAPINPTPSAPSPLGMRTLATPSSASGSRVAIQSVEADAMGGLVAKGLAEPNATVRLYLNQADLAEAKTQSDGRWSLTIQHGMSPGGYVMRADEIGQGAASSLASADTPFDYPDASSPAQTAPVLASASAEPSSAPSPANPVIASVQTKRVATGHTLWALSQSYYGDPTRYPEIVEANRAQIHNPNVIFPGQVFVVPKSNSKP
jgi:nucleoid-associated protein YgaU